MPESSAGSQYTVRNYLPADFDTLAALFLEAGRINSPRMLADNLRRPGYDPMRDLFLVLAADHPVGWLDITPEPGIDRVILDCWVKPEHRGRGLAARLLERAMRRAAGMGVAVAQANIPEDDATGQAILERMGFEVVRRFYDYELPEVALDRDAAAVALGECRCLCPGEEGMLADIQNRSFAGTWGYNPNTQETIAHRTRLAHFSFEDVVLYEVAGGIAGYCWTELDPLKGGHEGRICMLGVLPESREKGTGRRVLLAGLEHLFRQGAAVVVLTVDSGNQPACSLYWSLGFTLRNGSLWYEKPVAGR